MNPRVFRARRCRSGFSLAEVLVATALLAILAAAVVPTVMSKLAASRASAIVTEVSGLNASLQAFYKDVGDYPRFLSYLTTMPASNAATRCNPELFLPQQIASWHGPYSSRSISGDYTTPDGVTILNQMNYTPPNGITPAYLIISLNGIPADVAQDVENAIDGPLDGLLSGMFRWISPNGTYRIPIPTC
jgi:prepilin-type N-terminal cleavage/methylation domain-containing protein